MGRHPWRTFRCWLGVNIFVIVLVLLVILTIFSGVKTVSQGYHWTVERFGRYTARSVPAST